MHETNIPFYQRREAQERALAASAADKLARRLHLELANRYADRLRTLTAAAA